MTAPTTPHRITLTPAKEPPSMLDRGLRIPQECGMIVPTTQTNTEGHQS